MSDGLPSVTHLQPIDTHILGAWLLHVRGVTRYNPPISLFQVLDSIEPPNQ